MANEITFDKLPQAVGYLTEQVERIHKIVAALQPQTAIDKHRIVEIDEACKITRKGLIPASNAVLWDAIATMEHH
jgi:hypothetical protein